MALNEQARSMGDIDRLLKLVLEEGRLTIGALMGNTGYVNINHELHILDFSEKRI